MAQVQFFAVFLSFLLIYLFFNQNVWENIGSSYFATCFYTTTYGANLDDTRSCQHRLSNCGNASMSCKSFLGFQLSCEHNRTVFYYSGLGKYFVVENSINDTSFHVVDPGMQKDNCSTLPLYSFSYDSIESVPLYYPVETDPVVFVSCKNPVLKTKKSPRLYVDTAPCLTAAKDDYSYNYVVVGKNLVASDIEETCTVLNIFSADLRALDIGRENVSFQDIHNLLANDFEFRCSASGGMRHSFICKVKTGLYELFSPLLDYYSCNYLSTCFWGRVRSGFRLFVLAIAGRMVVGIILLFAFLIYKWHRRHMSRYDTIEEFLQKNNSLMPIRYSYKEIKTMTNNFKDKLGEGGYAVVYKGKL
ncbi:hypothetical protein ACH5RR_040468 [Cinchona calisaya]|uniref:Uncharacterized protein n=1 Tax=Cinchona calisaya TaxID=153742 RepID=A0ABD2XRV5_9GENT